MVEEMLSLAVKKLLCVYDIVYSSCVSKKNSLARQQLPCLIILDINMPARMEWKLFPASGNQKILKPFLQ